MNIEVKNGEMSQKEIDLLIEHLQKENPGRVLESVRIEIDKPQCEDDQYLNVSYTLEPVKFERIRRITGYLVGTMDRWNDGKRAEERDRVKHGFGDRSGLTK